MGNPDLSMNMLDDMGGSASDQAMRWLSWHFRISPTDLTSEKVIGRDLRPNSNSFFREETIDVIVEDVCDMRKLLKDAAAQTEEPCTVGEFCNLVKSVCETNPIAYQRMTKSWERLIGIDRKPRWRQLLFRVVGV